MYSKFMFEIIGFPSPFFLKPTKTKINNQINKKYDITLKVINKVIIIIKIC